MDSLAVLGRDRFSGRFLDLTPATPARFGDVRVAVATLAFVPFVGPGATLGACLALADVVPEGFVPVVRVPAQKLAVRDAVGRANVQLER